MEYLEHRWQSEVAVEVEGVDYLSVLLRSKICHVFTHLLCIRSGPKTLTILLYQKETPQFNAPPNKRVLLYVLPLLGTAASSRYHVEGTAKIDLNFSEIYSGPSASYGIATS